MSNAPSLHQDQLANRWLPLRSPQAGARFRLFCFPYAGGGASAYRAWSAALEPTIEVCAIEYPGRWSRHRERCETDVRTLAQSILTGLHGLLDQPFAFFGYSFGTLVAFEVARALRRDGLPTPQHLFVGAARPPHLGGRGLPIHALASGAFLDEIDRRYGILPAAVRRDPDLLKMVVPVLRADMTALETYQYRSEPPLDCAITAFSGTEDSLMSSSDLTAWGEQTSGQFHAETLPGGHFFISQSGPRILQVIRDALGVS